MKRTGLEKLNGMKVDGRMKQAGTPDRYGNQAAVALDKRERRKQDQALGLVPFAIKLDGELVKRIHARALEKQMDVNELLAVLLENSLDGKAR